MQTNNERGHGPEAILLVEDDDAVREVLSRALVAHGYKLLIAHNGEEALAAVDEYQGPIHLVISDIVMPNVGGLQLFERLRSWHPTIRFLFISGYSYPPLARRGLDEGRTRFLQKPFTVDRLMREGRSMLDLPGNSTALAS